tara:strand:- start:770 stop:1225 length:456 start_codon:yes stop_codon:yes gene_type:complete
MASFAEMRSDNNEILRIVVISDNDVDNNGGELSTQAETWVTDNINPCENIKEELGGTYPATYWKQTSYSNAFRGGYAHTGGEYDSVNDVFVRIKPFPSWVLEDNKWEWEAPVAKPTEEEYHKSWNEDLGRWEGTKEGGLYFHDGNSWSEVV